MLRLVKIGFKGSLIPSAVLGGMKKNVFVLRVLGLPIQRCTNRKRQLPCENYSSEICGNILLPKIVRVSMGQVLQRFTILDNHVRGFLGNHNCRCIGIP